MTEITAEDLEQWINSSLLAVRYEDGDWVIVFTDVDSEWLYRSDTELLANALREAMTSQVKGE